MLSIDIFGRLNQQFDGEIMKLEFTNRQLVLIQFACQERVHTMESTLPKMANGNQGAALQVVKDLKELVELLGEHIEVTE